ncbi:MAG: hypothetical protein KGL15_01505 [Acidobacteriota bacterium]|nr:hypothetical protein [Acidobacteriota bacterium]
MTWRGLSRPSIAFAGLAALLVATLIVTLALARGATGDSAHAATSDSAHAATSDSVRATTRDSARATPGSARISTASLRVIRARMVAKLRRDELSWRWVVCLRSGNSFQRVPVVRCNVDFGDPHIEAYCAVLRGGRLLTNFEDAAIPCGPDKAGDKQTIVTYG